MSVSPVGRPPFPLAPDEYDRETMDRFTRMIEFAFEQLDTPGPIEATTINLSALNGSGGGLRVGDVFSNGGILTIVRTEDVFAPSFLGTSALGTVIVTTV